MAVLLDELSKLISALDENKIEYAVCGGLALTIHGFPRATFEIDILIRPESLEKAYKTAAKFYRLIYCSALRKLKTFWKCGKH